jgi:hypothetical protein
MKSYKDITIEEKIIFLNKHFLYEVSMTFDLFFLDINSNNSKQKNILDNIRLESFIFHARNLIDFYYEKNKKGERYHKDDAWAIDYFDDEELWYENRPDISDWKDEFLKRAGKQIAHLTYSRLEINPENKEWNIYEIEKPLKRITILFIEKINNEFRTKKIKKLYNCLIDSLEDKNKLNNMNNNISPITFTSWDSGTREQIEEIKE